MRALSGIDETDLRATLAGRNDLATLRIIHGALALGVVSFAAMVAIIQATRAGAAAGEAGAGELVGTLSAVHGTIAASSWVAAIFLPSFLLRPARIERAATAAGPEGSGRAAAEAYLELVRPATIVRLALLEGAALFGLVVCLLAALDGTLAREPVWWLNAGSAAVFLAVVFATWPTLDRLAGGFEDLVRRAREG